MGLILLCVDIAAFYYFTGPTMPAVMFVIAQILFPFVLPIVLIIFCCFWLRKNIGGFWTFRQATTGLFVMFLTAYATQTITRDLVFAKFIEPNMQQKTEAAAIKETTFAMQGQKINQQLIDKKVDELKKDFSTQKPITIASVIQGLVFSVIFIFIFALIFAALFKKEAPVYQTVVDGTIPSA